MKFVIHGEPIAKARPRVERRGCMMIARDPQALQKNQVKNWLSILLKKALNDDSKEIVKEASSLASDEAFEVQMTFHLPLSQSLTNSKRNAKLWGLENCTSNKDLDNMEKFYLDCCNGVIFSDDRKVCSLSSTKEYSENPKTIINIMSKKELSLTEEEKGILELFGPDQFERLLLDCQLLANDELKRPEDETQESKELRLKRAAITLSRIAAAYNSSLSKIQKKFPDYWLKQMGIT